jgi:hypothetical protein
MDFVSLARPRRRRRMPTATPSRSCPAGRAAGADPPQQVFELAKALTQQLEFWEQETGRRTDG